TVLSCVMVLLGSVLGSAERTVADSRIATVPINQITSVSSQDPSADPDCITVPGFLPQFENMRDLQVSWTQVNTGAVVLQFNSGQIIRLSPMGGPTTEGFISVRVRLLVNGNIVPIGRSDDDSLDFFIDAGLVSLPPVSFTWLTPVSFRAQ